jgi:hypothetical protein
MDHPILKPDIQKSDNFKLFKKFEIVENMGFKQKLKHTLIYRLKHILKHNHTPKHTYK